MYCSKVSTRIWTKTWVVIWILYSELVVVCRLRIWLPISLFTHTHTFRFNSCPITGIYLFLKAVLPACWWTKFRRTKHDWRRNSITNRVEFTSFLSRHRSWRYLWSPTCRSQDPIIHGSVHYQPEIDSRHNRYATKMTSLSKFSPNLQQKMTHFSRTKPTNTFYKILMSELST